MLKIVLLKNKNTNIFFKNSNFPQQIVLKNQTILC